MHSSVVLFIKESMKRRPRLLSFCLLRRALYSPDRKTARHLIPYGSKM